MRRILQNLVLVLSFLFLAVAASAGEKPFKRALVISGGGISPAYGLGVIAGAQAAGYQPDIIFMVCGASMSAAIFNHFGDAEQAWKYVRSAEYQQTLRKLVKIDTRFALNMKKKLDLAEKNLGLLPPLFEKNLLVVPENAPAIFADDNFKIHPGRPRLVLQATRLLYGPGDVGTKAAGKIMYRKVFFTDAETALALRGMPSFVKQNFPDSYVDSATEVITNVPITQASRASVSDPFVMNPAKIGNDYYMTGAVDLFPITTAKAVADEVMVTAPNLGYGHYEILGMLGAFGFDPSVAALNASKQTGVHWIDVAGMQNLDPYFQWAFFRSGIPSQHEEYVLKVDTQYELAYRGAVEAVQARASKLKSAAPLR